MLKSSDAADGRAWAAQDTERIRIERTDEKVRLTLRKVMRKDDGEYSCRLVNAAGETTGYTNLFVRQPVE